MRLIVAERSSSVLVIGASLVFAGSTEAWAHADGFGPARLFQAWLLLALLAVGGFVYTLGVRRRRGRWPWWRSGLAIGGALAIAGALASPLDGLAATRLTAHMVQHTILILVAAPMLAAARPLAMLAAAIAPARLPRLLLRAPSPGLACLAHGAALWIWHLPGPYDLTLRSSVAHAFAHATLLGTAVLLWWSVARGRARLTGVLWLFVTALHAGALGALLALSARPWFAAHESLADQQLAGLVMWIPAGSLLVALVLINLATYLREGSRPRLGGTTMLLVCALIAGGLAACDTSASTASVMVGGDARRGKEAISRGGCDTCHTIPGVRGAAGTIGPPLTQVARRSYVAGAPNTPERLVEFLRHPRRTRPGTPMPDMNLTESDARDIAAYLYTLK